MMLTKPIEYLLVGCLISICCYQLGIENPSRKTLLNQYCDVMEALSDCYQKPIGDYYGD